MPQTPPSTQEQGHQSRQPSSRVSSSKKRVASAKYYDIASRLLGSGAVDIEEIFLNAAKDGDLERVEDVLQRRRDVIVNIDVKDKRTGNTPLIWAAKKGHVKLVHTLLKHGADVTLRNYEGHSALEVASPAIKTILLDSVERCSESSHRLLLQAAWQGNISVLRKLLNDNKVLDINCQNGEGLTPLLLVTRDIQLFERLSLQLNKCYTPVDVIGELLCNRADIRAVDSDGKTCLHHASSSKATIAKKMVAALVTSGSNLDLKDRRCFTPIHCASQSGNVDVLGALIYGGSDVNSKGFAGTTPLHITAYNDHERAAITLLKNGADIRLTDDSGLTALDLAKSKRLKNVLKEAWVDSTQKNPTKSLGPVKSSGRDETRSSLDNTRKKGAVIFDGLPENPFVSSSSNLVRPGLSRQLSNAEKAQLAEKLMQNDIDTGKFVPSPLPKDNVRKLGMTRSSPKSARKLAVSSDSKLPSISTDRTTPEITSSRQEKTRQLRKSCDEISNRKTTYTRLGNYKNSSLVPLSTDEGGVFITSPDVDLETFLKSSSGSTNHKKNKTYGHRRLGSDPYSPSIGELASSCDNFIPSKVRSKSLSRASDERDRSPSPSRSVSPSRSMPLRTPSEREIKIPSTIHEGKIIINPNKNKQKDATNRKALPLYPNSSTVLPPTPIAQLQRSYTVLSTGLIDFCEDYPLAMSKDTSPRSDEEEDFNKVRLAMSNPIDLLRSRSLLKADFILDESRPRDPLIQTSGSDSSETNISSINSNSPVVTARDSAKGDNNSPAPSTQQGIKNQGVGANNRTTAQNGASSSRSGTKTSVNRNANPNSADNSKKQDTKANNNGPSVPSKYAKVHPLGGHSAVKSEASPGLSNRNKVTVHSDLSKGNAKMRSSNSGSKEHLSSSVQASEAGYDNKHSTSSSQKSENECVTNKSSVSFENANKTNTDEKTANKFRNPSKFCTVNERSKNTMSRTWTCQNSDSVNRITGTENVKIISQSQSPQASKSGLRRSVSLQERFSMNVAPSKLMSNIRSKVENIRGSTNNKIQPDSSAQKVNQAKQDVSTQKVSQAKLDSSTQKGIQAKPESSVNRKSVSFKSSPKLSSDAGKLQTESQLNNSRNKSMSNKFQMSSTSNKSPQMVSSQKSRNTSARNTSAGNKRSPPPSSQSESTISFSLQTNSQHIHDKDNASHTKENTTDVHIQNIEEDEIIKHSMESNHEKNPENASEMEIKRPASENVTSSSDLKNYKPATAGRRPLVQILVDGESRELPTTAAHDPCLPIQTPLIVNPYEDICANQVQDAEEKNAVNNVKQQRQNSAKNKKQRNIKSAKKQVTKDAIVINKVTRRVSAGKKRGVKGKKDNTSEDRPKSGKTTKRCKSGKKKGDVTDELSQAVNQSDVALISGIGWHIATDCADTTDVKSMILLSASDDSESDEELDISPVIPQKQTLTPVHSAVATTPRSPRFHEVKTPIDDKIQLPVMENDGYPPMNLDMTQDSLPHDEVGIHMEGGLPGMNIEHLPPILETSFSSKYTNSIDSKVDRRHQGSDDVHDIRFSEKLSRNNVQGINVSTHKESKIRDQDSPQDRSAFRRNSSDLQWSDNLSDSHDIQGVYSDSSESDDKILLPRKERRFSEAKVLPPKDDNIDDVIDEILSSSLSSTLKSNSTLKSRNNTLTNTDKNLLLKLQNGDSPFHAKKDVNELRQSESYVGNTNPQLLQVFHGENFKLGQKVKAMIDAGADTAKVKLMMNVDNEEKKFSRVMNSFKMMELQPPDIPKPDHSSKGPTSSSKPPTGRPGSSNSKLKGKFHEIKTVSSTPRMQQKSPVMEKNKKIDESDFNFDMFPRSHDLPFTSDEDLAGALIGTDTETVCSRISRRNSASGSVCTVDSDQSLEDETIQWKKGNVLGKGAFGTVWCGLTSTGELIAVKQIELNINDREKAQREYEKVQEEVELLKTLRHKNIVGYMGTSLEESTVSLFMQFVPGGSIASILARFGALDEEVFQRYTRQILHGVEYLHQNDVIHRDIKGGNVMLMPNGVIKLIDFGCAKRLYLNLSMGQSNSHILKSMKGTPYWMAPEVVNETGHGKKSDIWSIGCTVFEMATRKPPWADMNPMAAIFAIGSDMKEVPQLKENFTSDARQFVKACLTKDQSKRPSATELLQHSFMVKKKQKK